MTFWSNLLAQCPCSGGSRFPWGIWMLVASGLYAIVWWAESTRKKEGTARMVSKLSKLVVVIGLIAAVGAIFAMKKSSGPGSASDSTAQRPTVVPAEQPSPPMAHASASQPDAAPAKEPETPAPLPRLVDLGSKSCIPCRMMAPILDELRAEQAGRLEVEFIDVRDDAAAGARYGIRLIPTQVFLDATGKELWRHEGFMAKQDILDKCHELGIQLAGDMTIEAADREADSAR